MGLTAKENLSNISIPQGLHRAICYGVWDLGTQFDHHYGRFSRKVMIAWELADVRRNIERDGQTFKTPFSIFRKYTLSLHRKSSLRRHLESWRGSSFSDEELNGFDLKKLLGKTCLINITHYRSPVGVRPVISAIVPSSDQILAENGCQFFSLDDHSPLPRDTPAWLADIIAASDEWRRQGRTGSRPDNDFKQVIGEAAS